jgi:hypothetical protein
MAVSNPNTKWLLAAALLLAGVEITRDVVRLTADFLKPPAEQIHLMARNNSKRG